MVCTASCLQLREILTLRDGEQLEYMHRHTGTYHCYQVGIMGDPWQFRHSSSPDQHDGI